LWTLPWAGLLVLWWDERLDCGTSRSARPRFFLVGLLLCSSAAVGVGFYFRLHYFIFLVPIMALLCGEAVSRGVHALRHERGLELFVAMSVLGLFVAGALGAVAGNTPLWFSRSPDQVVRDIYGTTLFSEAKRISDYLKSNTPPDARVAVLGSEPEIFFYAHRRSASGYIYTYPLMETHSYALKMQEEMIAEIERSKPDYFVYVDDDYSWLPRESSQHRLEDWWKTYWPANLDLVMTIPVEYGSELEEIPGLDIKKEDFNAPQPPRHLLVYKRR
jgi:hypothetical protein